MIGYPTHLNTKADYEYIRKNFPKEKWLPHFQALLDTKDNFFVVKTLGEKDAGIESKTKKVVEQENGDGVLERIQLALKPDPNSKLLRIGFSVADIESALQANSDVAKRVGYQQRC